jgi:hypothetical protein
MNTEKLTDEQIENLKPINRIPRFIQISALNSQFVHIAPLYALDDQGEVWGYYTTRVVDGKMDSTPGWVKVCMDRLAK